MMNKVVDVSSLVRSNILQLKAYSSARSEFSGQADVFLDANENPFENGLNRYPDPLAKDLKIAISVLKNVPANQIALGNGSDEIIDLVFRIFCEPGKDNVIILPPTYGMYKVCADINNVSTKEVPLLPGFQPDIQRILETVDDQTKALWLCTPNNPTANDFSADAVQELLRKFKGIVIVDEAYIDFSEKASYTSLLDQFPNLIVMQTFSKAWGMAGIRLGMAFASSQIIQLINAVKPPYNVNTLSQETALKALQKHDLFAEKRDAILAQRDAMISRITSFPFVLKIFPSSANFILIKVNEPRKLYEFLQSKGIIVRDRSGQLLCGGCLRITIGTKTENEYLINTLKTF